MRRRFAAVCLAALLASCGADSDGDVFTLSPTSNDVAGAYNMRTANGTQPPFTAFVTVTEEWQLSGDKIEIATDGTWKETTTYVVVSRLDGSSGNRETLAQGTYTIANGQINFVMTSGGADRFAGSVNGTELTLLYNGKIFVYVR